MPEVTSRDNVSLHYSVEGPESAPSVLLCHSLGTTSELWMQQTGCLSARFRVIAYDTRGHGRSSVASGRFTVETLGHDVLAVLDACGAAASHIAGISLGGLTAMWVARYAPQRVQCVVLAHTAARLGNPQRWNDRIDAVLSHGMAGIVDQTMQTWFSADFRMREPRKVEFFRRMLLACDPEGYAACCSVLCNADLRSEVGRIAAPTLIIAGAHDTATPPVDAEDLRARIAGAALHIVDAAHLGNVEQPDIFNGLMADFFCAQGQP